MAMSIQTRGTFKPGLPTALFDTRINHLWDDARNHFDVSRDGQRFLVTRPLQEYGTVPLTVVVNVTTGVARRPQHPQ